jgi:hypothetical protein
MTTAPEHRPTYDKNLQLRRRGLEMQAALARVASGDFSSVRHWRYDQGRPS